VDVGWDPCEDEGYTNRIEAEMQKVFHDRSGAYEGSVPVWRNVFRVSNTETSSRRSVRVQVRQPDGGLEHDQGTIVKIGTRNEGTLVEVPIGALVAAMWEHKLAPWKWMIVLLALWEKAKDSNLRSPVGYLPLVVGDVALGMRPRRWILLDPPFLAEQAWDHLMAKRAEPSERS
jgi:hypothetical protein